VNERNYIVPSRLKRIVAVWFVLQIVLPFTAPLHMCDLNDLLGTGKSQAPFSPSSPTTPTPANESDADTNSFVSPLTVSTLSASISLVDTCDVALGGLFTPALALTSSPQVQQTVLRL
jgi:hypothetical protein